MDIATGANSVASLLERAVERKPLTGHAGFSGATLERLLMPDGEQLILKRLSPANDFIMRRTQDEGRVLRLWQEGVFERIPPVIDPAIVTVEADEEGLSVVMRDVTDSLVGARVLSREENRRILSAGNALYEEFWGEEIPNLCPLLECVRRFTVTDEDNHPFRELIHRGWEQFRDVVPSDVADAVFAIHRDPEVMAAELARCEKSLIHGDFRLANIGLTSRRVVLLDWGSFTAIGPPAIEFTYYLAISWAQIYTEIDDVVKDFRQVCGARFDERALDLGFLLALAHLGWNKAMVATEGPDEAIRSRELDHLAWWVAQVRRSLEAWSPA